MSAFGISGIGPSCSLSPIQYRYIPTSASVSPPTVTTPQKIQTDQTSLSCAGGNALQRAYLNNAVIQTALDSARAIMEKMVFIKTLLEDIESNGFDTTWVDDATELLNMNTHTLFGGTVLEENTFLESLLNEFQKQGSDTSWVVNVIELLNKQINHIFGIASQSIFIKEANTPLKPLIEASVLETGMSYEDINSTKFSLDLNATDRYDVKSAADAFIKRLAQHLERLEKYTSNVNSSFQALVAETTETSSGTIDPAMVSQVASEIAMQIQSQGNSMDLHREISPTRVLALLQ